MSFTARFYKTYFNNINSKTIIIIFSKYKGLYISKYIIYLQGGLTMEKYYENDITPYLLEIGKQRFKVVFKRNAKKGFVFFMTNIYINTLCSIGSIGTMIWSLI